MKNKTRSMPESGLGRHSQGGQGGFGEFFRYHGWMSPGVRWFRQFSFKAKAGVIALVFLVPLATSTGLLWHNGGQGIAVAQSERQGLDYLRPLFAFIQAAQAHRHAALLHPTDLPALQQKLDAAFEQIETQHRRSGTDFVAEERHQEFRRQYATMRNAALATTPEDIFQPHEELIRTALRLVTTVTDGAQLSLDPDLDTFHMMNVSVLRGPRQTENTAKIKTMGELALTTAQLDPARRDAIGQWMAVQKILDDDVESSYQTGISTDPEADHLFDMKGTDDAFDAFMTVVRQQIMGTALEGEVATYARLGDKIVAKQNELNGQILEELDRRLQKRIDRLQRERFLELGASLLCVSIALYLMVAFYRVMTGGLNEVAGHLQEISKGNLTTAPLPWGTDEAAQLMLSLRDMQTSLRRTVGIVINSTYQVHAASDDIARAAADLAVRTEQSSTSLQQTSLTMGHIASAATQAAATVDAATSSVKENAQVAERGGQVIAEVVRTMEGIRLASTRISEIISAIDGIAFQTNILALNAAVEASRAGEHGRGFAVVATEVRALAGRSAAAAKEIKALVGSNLVEVRNGAVVVTDAGRIMSDIVSNAAQVTQWIGEISAAARVQQRSLEEMSMTVNELGQSTQQNAMLVEQSSSASVALAEQARFLSHEVSQFRLPVLPVG